MRHFASGAYCCEIILIFTVLLTGFGCSKNVDPKQMADRIADAYMEKDYEAIAKTVSRKDDIPEMRGRANDKLDTEDADNAKAAFYIKEAFKNISLKSPLDPEPVPANEQNPKRYKKIAKYYAEGHPVFMINIILNQDETGKWEYSFFESMKADSDTSSLLLPTISGR